MLAILSIALLAAQIVSAYAAPIEAQLDKPLQLKRAHIAGYQGWFRCPDDDPRKRWTRWFRYESSTLIPTVDMWPDLSEVAEEDKCDTGLRDLAGEKIWAFSSLNKNISRLHARWAYQYNIDGFAIQRFVSYLTDGNRLNQFDIVLQNMRESLSFYKRGYFMMYDISGGKDGWQDLILNDIRRLSSIGVFSDKNYMHHESFPVIAIWGFGVPGRPNNTEQMTSMIQALKSGEVGGIKFSLLGGVGYRFRSLISHPNEGRNWEKLFKSLDIISPWYVGAVNNTKNLALFGRDHLEGDKQWAYNNNVEFMYTIFPGFSWTNLKAHRSPENQIPRDCGGFYSKQIELASEKGIEMIFTAMFDELDEATAIMKVISRSNSAPVGIKSITMDEDGCVLPSDTYLQISSRVNSILKRPR